MLDIQLLRHEPAKLAEKLLKRGYKLDTDKIDSLEEKRKYLQVKTEELQHRPQYLF